MSIPEAKQDAKCPFRSQNGWPMGDASHIANISGYVIPEPGMMEKQQTFNRAKTLERMVHPCGTGAFGYFETTADCSKWTKAAFLQGAGKKTDVFIRFSTVTYGREFPDSARNPRGFAVKFYTEDGNYDVVGLNFPIFFVRDGALGPDVIRSQQRRHDNFLLNFDSLFDWMSLVPESMHCNTMFFSDYGTPYGFRHMDAYGCHTFKWVNAEGQAVYVKYHFISDVGVKNFSFDEARIVCGQDPDFAKRDLHEWISAGKEAKWTMKVQIMTEEQATKTRFDPFDVTKVWPHGEFPLHTIGRLVINKNPENYHRDVEQAAFHPGSLVPGIETSPDPLFNWRAWFYRDAQFHRLGVNLHQIPVNCPLGFKGRVSRSCPARDGVMRIDENGGDQPHYFPNSMGTVMGDAFHNPRPVAVAGNIDKLSGGKHEDEPIDRDFEQCRELFTRVMDDKQRAHLFYNIAEGLKLVHNGDIVTRFLAMCYRVHPDYAGGVAKLLKLDMKPIENLAKNFTIDRKQGYKMVPVNAEKAEEKGILPRVGTTVEARNVPGSVKPLTSCGNEPPALLKGHKNPAGFNPLKEQLDKGTGATFKDKQNEAPCSGTTPQIAG